jgi:hypothetical protein
MDEKESLRTDEIRAFSLSLSAISHAYRALADWLDEHEIKEIPGAGTPTAKRALGYLAGYTEAVLKSFSRALLPEHGEPPSQLLGDMLRAEAKARAAAAKRVEIDEAAALQNALDKAEEMKAKMTDGRQRKKTSR